MFSLNDLTLAARRPVPYEPGEELWNDRHISEKMLEAHLSPHTDAASYRLPRIRAICDFLSSRLKLAGNSRIADLGCGPGLYSALLEEKGFRVTGIDRSENSIRYAKKHSRTKTADFVCESYLNPFGTAEYDAAIMISEDYGVLGPDDRKNLLRNIRAALTPNGYFAFDISSMAAFQMRQDRHTPAWYASETGFWRPHKHFVLEKSFFYPDIPALCDLAAVFDYEIKIYRIWQTFFSPDSIRAELEDGGFQVEAVFSNLWGDSYAEDARTIGIICRKS